MKYVVIMKSHFPGQLAESFWLGIYQSILNRAVLQICKIWYISMIQGSFTDFSALYTVLKLEKMVSGVLEQYDVVITFMLESLSKENKFK